MEAADIGLAVLRLALGLVCLGHAARKGLGWFNGPGIARAGGAFEAAGYRPGGLLVVVASSTEFLGGILLLTGLLWPLGCMMIIGSMLVASSTHTGNGFWASAGGFELPFTYVVVATGLLFAGPGRFALDVGPDLTTGQLVLAWCLGVLAAVGMMVYRAALRRMMDRSDREAVNR